MIGNMKARTTSEKILESLRRKRLNNRLAPRVKAVLQQPLVEQQDKLAEVVKRRKRETRNDIDEHCLLYID